MHRNGKPIDPILSGLDRCKHIAVATLFLASITIASVVTVAVEVVGAITVIRTSMSHGAKAAPLERVAGPDDRTRADSPPSQLLLFVPFSSAPLSYPQIINYECDPLSDTTISKFLALNIEQMSVR